MLGQFNQIDSLNCAVEEKGESIGSIVTIEATHVKPRTGCNFKGQMWLFRADLYEVVLWTCTTSVL